MAWPTPDVLGKQYDALRGGWGASRLGAVSPTAYGALATWYDASDTSTMLKSDGTVAGDGEAVALWADKSGNSAVNVLCLNGVAGNYASALDSAALDITGDIEMVARFNPANLTQSSALVAKRVAGQWSYQFIFSAGTSQMGFGMTTDGSTGLTYNSTAFPAFVALTTYWFRVTRRKSDGRIQFFYAADQEGEPSSWTQIGADVTGDTGDMFIGTAGLEVGSNRGGTNNLAAGNFYRAIVRDAVSGGTTVFDADFSTAAKLATSFAESSSNAATVTINTSGDLGARICGARDLVQMTGANQPLLTIAVGANLLTFDGSSDYMKAAAFALVQPETVYFVGSQVTWTGNDQIYGGGSLTARMDIYQNTTTPNVTQFAGSNGGTVTTWALGANGVLTAVFNAASSSLRLNRGALSTGDAGSQTPNGFTLGARGDAAAFANITASEIAVYAAAQDTATQNRVVFYLGRKWKVAV